MDVRRWILIFTSMFDIFFYRTRVITKYTMYKTTIMPIILNISITPSFIIQNI
jgi:hypothetical protein